MPRKGRVRCTSARTVVLIASAILSSCDRPTPGTSDRAGAPVPAGSTDAAAANKPLTPQDIARNALPSVAWIEITDQNGTPVALGTGFVIESNAIVTNHHVIREGVGGTVRLFGSEREYRILGIIAEDPEHDVVVLRAELSDATPLKRAVAPLEIGQRVYVVGNPQGLEGTFSEGIVSAIRVLAVDTLIQLTAPISPGSSGGPVLDEKGRVVGVATATLRGGQNLNFAVPVGYVTRTLVAASGDVRRLTARSPARGSVWSQFGERNVEGVVAAEFIWGSAVSFDIVGYYHGAFSFSIRNKLDMPVEDVKVLIVFKDRSGEPIEVAMAGDIGVIPPRLARRVSGKVAGDVQSITTPDGSRRPHPGRLDIRVLDFKIVQ
jgi:hypothetical protein